MKDCLSQETEKRREDLEIYIPPGPRLGDIVFEFKASPNPSTTALLLDAFSATIPPGSIVGVIGPNGAGKTTLLKMITGSEKPDSGTIKIGETVKLAYADQLASARYRKDRLGGDQSTARMRSRSARAR